MKKLTTIFIVVFTVSCCCFASVYAQQEGQADDPAGQLATEELSTVKDVSEYTEAELPDLYLNNPQDLPEMSDEQLTHLTDLATL